MTLLERLEHIRGVLSQGVNPACLHMRNGRGTEAFALCGDHPEVGMGCVMCHEAHLMATHIFRPLTMCDTHPDRPAAQDGACVMEVVDVAIRTPDAWEGRFTGAFVVNPAVHRCDECANAPSDPTIPAA